MPTYYGDSPIKRMSLSQSWGINPGAAEIECVGTLSPAVGEEMWLTLGGTTWFGTVKGYQTKTSVRGGVTTTLRLVDNRDVLMRSYIAAQFNMQDSDGKWYCVYPGSDWLYQQRTYTTLQSRIYPANIISYILQYTGFSYEVTSVDVAYLLLSKDNTCHNLDWNLGRKRGLALLEVCDRLGLHFTIGRTPATVLIGRKGGITNFLSGNFTDHAEGQEQSLIDDRVTVVGEPNIYELTDVPLYKDWPDAWDDIAWNDAALMALLRSINPTNPLSVTVADMAVDYYDDELYAGYPRYQMLARDYADSVPFKVYKLDLTSSVTLNGHSNTLAELMPIHDRLVSDIEAPAKIKYTGFVKDPRRPLQPVEIVTDDTGGGYEIDKANGKVIFQERKFKGDVLTLVGNQYKIDYTALEADTPLLTFAVQRELYQYTWGSGNSRVGSHHVRNLRKEYVCNASGTITQTIDRGVVAADTYARRIAILLANRPRVTPNGFATRHGQSGYRLSDEFDRITVTLSEGGGLQEDVTYASEQPQIGIPTEREMERRVKATAPKTDLQKANEIWDAVQAAISDGKATTSRANRGAGGGGRISNSVEALEDVTIIDPNGITSVKNYGGTFDFGEIVCSSSIDATTGQHVAKDPATVTNDDPSVLGVVIEDCTDSTHDIKVRTSGLVTVYVNGVVAEGDDIGPVAGQVYGQAGKVGLGKAKEAKAGAGTGYVRVQLGSGGGSAILEEFYQVATPTPVSGKINLWYKSGSGGDSQYAAHHFFIYSFGQSAWIDIFGWI